MYGRLIVDEEERCGLNSSFLPGKNVRIELRRGDASARWMTGSEEDTLVVWGWQTQLVAYDPELANSNDKNN